MGDGIMAIFGAPLAHEDHLRGRVIRLCRCRIGEPYAEEVRGPRA